MQKLYISAIRNRDRRKLPGWVRKTATVCAEIATVVLIFIIGFLLMGAGY